MSNFTGFTGKYKIVRIIKSKLLASISIKVIKFISRNRISINYW